MGRGADLVQQGVGAPCCCHAHAHADADADGDIVRQGVGCALLSSC